MAGYCAVIHALQLKGIDGHYGNQRKVIIFGFGAVSRGAIYALKAHGFRDITICIQRPDHEVREEVLDCHYINIKEGDQGESRMVFVEHDGSRGSLTDLIQESDIIVNGVFQDIANPVDFLNNDEVKFLKPHSLIIDVSCDEGMGFPFAKPTTFKNPTFKVNNSDYYAVDHTPSYLWESATRSISAALITHLSDFVTQYNSWEENKTINKAINIRSGEIIKSSILSFQNRDANYPYRIKSLDCSLA
jgi:alanine dehydrogenase